MNKSISAPGRDGPWLVVPMVLALTACTTSNVLRPDPVAPAPQPGNAQSGKRFAGDSQPASSPAGQSNARSGQAAQRDIAGGQSGCLNASSVSEPDIRRNASALSGFRHCIEVATFSEAGIPWKVYRITNRQKPSKTFWAVPHDDEDTAFDTAVYALGKYGGTLVTVETGDKRIFRGQDTNRNFGTTPAVARRCRQQRAAAPRFTSEFLKGYSGGLMVALHTNNNGWSGGGGSGTISIRRPANAVMQPYPANGSGALADEDNLLIVSSRSKTGKVQRVVNHFNRRGIHVVGEHVTSAKNDCSLSNYVILQGRGSYYNIEVQHGNGRVQRTILDELMRFSGR